MDRLSGVVRAYDWGDLQALADLLGRDPSGRPEAEYWLGAHPSAPALLQASGRPLDQAVAAAPELLLGRNVADRFGELPFLVKILAARQALSIQAHPSQAQAVAGFAREERAGIERGAANRTYRDRNHKPELICALTPFEARCGFRDPAETLAAMQPFGPVLDPVRECLASSGPADAALWLLGLPAETAAELTSATVAAATKALDRLGPGTLQAELSSTIDIGCSFPDDVGVVVALLLNHVVLEPGQALFLGAGNVHAYLGGVAVEVMANSDNVIRGGLTSKHIDVDELASVVDRGWGPVVVQTPTIPVHTFEAPVPDFSLTRIDATSVPVDPIDVVPTGPEILLVTAGSLTVTSAETAIDLGPGQAAFVSPMVGPCQLRVSDGTLAWRVTVG